MDSDNNSVQSDDDDEVQDLKVHSHVDPWTVDCDSLSLYLSVIVVIGLRGGSDRRDCFN